MTETIKRKPGRPKKEQDVKEEETIKAEEITQAFPVKHVVRGISTAGITVKAEDGPVQYSVIDVEITLAEYYRQGYKLLETHFLGLEPHVYNVMYILVLP